MKAKRIAWLALYFCVPLLPVYFFLAKAAKNTSNILYLSSGVLGIVAFVFFVNQFVIASRPKFIEKNFGMDKLYRFHMVMPLVAFVLGLIHNQIKESMFAESFQTALGTAVLILFGTVIVLSVLFMINKLFFKIKPVDWFRAKIKKYLKLKHEVQVLIHNVTVLGVCILFVHILLSYSIRSNLPLEITLSAYFAFACSLYFYHKVLKPNAIQSKKYVVTEVIRECDTIVTVKFQPEGHPLLHYQPGQYLYLKLFNAEIPNDEHPFTLSSSPTQKDTLSITAKQLGDFTRSLVKAKAGDKATIDGGFGSFTHLRLPSQARLCFIAGGIGITPFLSMLRYMSAVDRDREVVLIWGVRDISELICKEELGSIARAMARFTLIPVVSSDGNYAGEKGYVDGARIKRLLNNDFGYDFFLCGPPIMMENVVKDLKSLSVHANRVHYERFSI